MPREKNARDGPPHPAVRRKQMQQLRARLETERRGWARWLARLKRAFGAFVKAQARVTRIERLIAKVQEAARQAPPTNH
jgi:hypothetical protein